MGSFRTSSATGSFPELLSKKFLEWCVMLCFDFKHQRKDGSFDVFVFFPCLWLGCGNCLQSSLCPYMVYLMKKSRKSMKVHSYQLLILRFRRDPHYDQFVSESVRLNAFFENRDVLLVLVFKCNQSVCLIFLFMKFPKIVLLVVAISLLPSLSAISRFICLRLLGAFW